MAARCSGKITRYSERLAIARAFLPTAATLWTDKGKSRVFLLHGTNCAEA